MGYSNPVGCTAAVGADLFPKVVPTLETGPMTRWDGLEMLVDVLLEGCEVLVLAGSGSRVNTMTLEFYRSRVIQSCCWMD